MMVRDPERMPRRSGAISVSSIVFTAVSAWLLFGCAREVPTQPMTGAPGQACIADSIESLRLTPEFSRCEFDDSSCRVECTGGSATACLAIAYAAERDPAHAAEATAFYQRACLLGAANACTNFAAHLWSNEHSEAQLACAQRTFEKACTVRESFACGMVGRMMLEAAEQPRFADARKYLEAACTDAGGFSCRVLAKHLESGKLGAYPPGTIGELLAKACAGGDPDACGEPATAAETFDQE
jgi:hypothetical protein